MAKKLITEQDVEELVKNNVYGLSLCGDDVITPLALDLIKKHGIKLDYDQKNGEEGFPVELILKFYYFLLKIRFFEELVKNYKERNIIPGLMVHSYLGQEAIATGVCCALGENDFLTSTHRGHGHLIAKGADLGKMLAEMLGKVDGYCRGKGGSMHITDIGLGILGANGIVGAGMPIACGSALASRLNADNGITVSFFGDGASNQGTFGESLNFAKIFSLPVLFLCENNGYAISTPISYGCGSQSIYKRANGYEIISEQINGDDVFEVYKASKKHIDQMRVKPHPVLIEAVTHRRIGHWVGDPQNYRPSRELESLPEYDPIRIFMNKIKNRQDILTSRLEEIQSRVSGEIIKAADFAAKSPYPDPEEATKDFLKE